MSLIYIILTALAVLIVLLGCEYWWRKKRPHGEFSRKFIHITIGSFVAFWPFFLSWREIQLLCLAFIIVISLSKWLHIFQAIHSVQRPTWGEVYFALAVGVTTLVTHSKLVYAVSLLQMSLADGLAAVIGVRYGRNQRYYIWGHPKSIIGTASFLIIALALLLGYRYCGGHISGSQIIGLALVATVVENLAIGGLDNLLVPAVVAAVLMHLT